MKKKILLIAVCILVSLGILSISKIVLDSLNKNTTLIQQEVKEPKSEEVDVKNAMLEQVIKEETDKENVKAENAEQEVKEVVENKTVTEGKTTNAKTSSTEKVVVAKKDEVVIKENVPAKIPEPKKEPNLIIENSITGKIILSANVSIENKTVADITRSGVGNNYAATGRGETTYITRIYDLKARDDGPLSGWCYYVNGVKPGVSCGAYKLKSGDVVEWKYLEDAVNN